MHRIYFTYILLCADGSYYVGVTNNLKVRVQNHKNGEGCVYTSSRLPVELVYFEEYDFIQSAIAREKQLKGWSRKKKEALMAGDLKQLSFYSQKKSKQIEDPLPKDQPDAAA